jgi:hypothetical protein
MTPEDAISNQLYRAMSSGDTSMLGAGSSRPADDAQSDALGGFSRHLANQSASPEVGAADVVDLLPEDRPSSLPGSVWDSDDEDAVPAQLTLPLLDGAKSTPTMFQGAAASLSSDQAVDVSHCRPACAGKRLDCQQAKASAGVATTSLCSCHSQLGMHHPSLAFPTHA